MTKSRGPFGHREAPGGRSSGLAQRTDYLFTGKPRLTPPWLGSSQREVTALPLV
jgi:hypothetical protein